MTIWPGALSLAGAQTSSSPAASAAMSATSSRARPSTAAMAPSPTGTARCMASPRRFSSRAAAARSNVPAAASAEYSPREWPATNAARAPRSSPPSRSSVRSTAMLVAISAGCAFSVRTSSSSGPSNISRVRFCLSASSTSSRTSRAASDASHTALAMPTAWEPCPGNTNACLAIAPPWGTEDSRPSTAPTPTQSLRRRPAAGRAGSLARSPV